STLAYCASATTIVGFTVGPVAFDESLADALGLLSALGAGQRFTRGGLRHSTCEPNPVPGDPEPNERHKRDNSRGTLREARGMSATFPAIRFPAQVSNRARSEEHTS